MPLSYEMPLKYESINSFLISVRRNKNYNVKKSNVNFNLKTHRFSKYVKMLKLILTFLHVSESIRLSNKL